MRELTLTDSYDTGAEPIAIVGMAVRVPGAGDLGQFWSNLIDGVESVTFFDPQEQRARGASEADLADPAFVPAAPVLDQMEYFDAPLFGMTAREAEITDPQQRVFLELAHRVLADAGCDPARYPGEIAVYAGTGADDYKWLNVHRNRNIATTTGTLSVSVGNHPDYIATMVSYRLNLRGPSMTLHTACSTSLVAVHLACESLRAGECDMALAGGVCVELPHGRGYTSAGGFTSSDGHCRPFDAKADGTIWGSGAGLVALKRLPDALADGDHVRALILGNAVNNDGATKVGFSAPSVEGQAEAIAQALGVAAIDPRTIGYVEAHGTGTALGDPIEIAALCRVYTAASQDRDWCGIGSVKSNFGHLSQAAGVVGLIKAALALEHGLIPPSINFSEPNPAIDFESSPFYVVSTLSRWESAGGPRRAAVSSFGIGGTNAHLVLQEAPEQVTARHSGGAPRPAELLRISARTDSALAASVTRLADHLAAEPKLDLGSVAHTLHTGRPEYACRAFVVASGPAEAAAALRDGRRLASGRSADPAPRLGLLFSGQGTQYPGMGQQLYRAEPAFAAAFDECCEVIGDQGIDLRAILWDEAATQGPDGLLTNTRYAQPALFAIEYALAALWQSWGVVPAAMIGHSIGEYLAATVAGVFTLHDALRLVALRGRLTSAMPPGSMLAVQLDEAQVARRLPSEVCIAAINGPGMCVVAGPTGAVSAFARALKDAGIRSTVLRTSHAFHSPMMDPIAGEFAAAVSGTPRARPRIPFLSNVTGDWITEQQATDPRYWAAQLRQPVLFGRCVASLAASGSDAGQSWALVECGPGRQLASMARMQLPPGWPRPLPSLPGPGEKAEDVPVIYGTAGRLWLAGLPVGAGASAGCSGRVPLPGYPYERKRHWVDPDQGSAAAAAPGEDAGELATRPRPVAEWFAVPTWRQAAPLPSDLPAGRFAVFAADPRGEELASALREHGVSVVTVRPGSRFSADSDGWQVRAGEREDYDALLDALASSGGVPDRFVHAWALAGGPAGHDVEAAWAAQERGFFSLLRLVQAIAAAQPRAPHLDVLVAGTEDVRGDDLLWPEHATTAGITRVAPLEVRGLAARRIDLDPGGTPVRMLLSELASPPVAETVALRGGRRWLTEFASVILPAADGTTVLREQGRYLITGGLGGIGITLAADLAQQLRPRLVLLSRTGLPPRAEWDAMAGGSDRVSRAIAAVRQMEQAGAQVHLITADVADTSAMRRVRDEVAAMLGGLDGVIHAAGVPGGGMAEVRDVAAARAVLAPKLAGTLALLSSLGEMTADFIALCSSVTALVGGVGQADYCAANAFLDACARSRPGQRARLISLNWGGWSDVGMLAEATAVPASRKRQRSQLTHPLLTTCVDSGDCRRCDGQISAGTHWVLDEHRIGGVPVLPGTAHLEAARATASLGDPAGAGTVELTDVMFIEPLRVPGTAELSVTLDGSDFQVTSDGRTFSRGSARICDPGPGGSVDIAAVRARCHPVPWVAWRSGRTSAVTFGARWDCLRQVWAGDGEELALIEAPAQVAAELDRWVLHPALLDVATAFGMTRREGAYLPLSYGRVVVRAALPGRFYSYLRHELSGGGVLSAAVTICDEQGRELVAITDFTLRLVEMAPAGLLQAGSTAAPGAAPLVRPGGQAVPGTSSGGLISPADGASAFRRILAADPGPQIAITPIPVPQIAARNRRAGADVTEGAPKAEAGAGEAAARAADLEGTLTRIWADVLGVEPADPSDSFFDLGGNSLVAVALIGTIREAVGVRLPMGILFQAPTVAGMAAHIRRLLAAVPPAKEGAGAARPGQIPRIPRPER